jgi:class 3 adenylate cyclase
MDRWEYFVFGKAAETMNDCVDLAKNTEIVLCAECRNALNRCNAGSGSTSTSQPAPAPVVTGIDDMTSLEEGQYWKVHPDVGISTLRPWSAPASSGDVPLTSSFNDLKKYVPGAIVSRMTCGLSLNVSSLREVVVVFIKLLDIDFLNKSSADVLARIQSAIQMTQTAAYLVFATLRQFVVDDKGAVAIVVVGLPPYFHEDNSARGVTIALEISENKDHATSVGVTTGVCFCGCVGNESRTEYSVVGDTMNLAARLMGKAGRDEVLCDLVTAEKAKDAFQFESMPPVKVKGKEVAVPVFRPLLYSDRRVLREANRAGGGGGYSVDTKEEKVRRRRRRRWGGDGGWGMGDGMGGRERHMWCRFWIA